MLWLFAANRNFDSNCILIYTVSSSNSVLVSISILILLSRSLIFPPILAFGKSTHREGIGGTNDRARGRPRRMAPRGVTTQCVGPSGLSSSLPRTLLHSTQIWFVKWPIVMILFKLEIWETLGKPCSLELLSGYWRCIRIIENTDQISRPLQLILSFCPIYIYII